MNNPDSALTVEEQAVFDACENARNAKDHLADGTQSIEEVRTVYEQSLHTIDEFSGETDMFFSATTEEMRGKIEDWLGALDQPAQPLKRAA